MSTTTWSMHRKKIWKAADVLLHLGQVAEQPVGFDQVLVRNAVLEPLEEENIQVEARAEE